MTANEIRKQFLDFFEERGHQIANPAPIVVKGDSTLMFTNAGMNQFKELFLGNQPVKHPRVADTQHCLRVSGKHNDLEDVGHDTYHHTLLAIILKPKPLLGLGNCLLRCLSWIKTVCM
jgi:alanyl-tRNA synthetase